MHHFCAYLRAWYARTTTARLSRRRIQELLRRDRVAQRGHRLAGSTASRRTVG